MKSPIHCFSSRGADFYSVAWFDWIFSFTFRSSVAVSSFSIRRGPGSDETRRPCLTRRNCCWSSGAQSPRTFLLSDSYWSPCRSVFVWLSWIWSTFSDGGCDWTSKRPTGCEENQRQRNKNSSRKSPNPRRARVSLETERSRGVIVITNSTRSTRWLSFFSLATPRLGRQSETKQFRRPSSRDGHCQISAS